MSINKAFAVSIEANRKKQEIQGKAVLFCEAERFANRISKTQTFIDLHNYLTSSAVFYILPIQNKWLKCKK